MSFLDVLDKVLLLLEHGATVNPSTDVWIIFFAVLLFGHAGS